MEARRLARLALATDAIYCAASAAGVLVFAEPLAHELGVDTVILVIAGVGAALWAAALLRVAREPRLRDWLVGVLVANVLAAGLIMALALAHEPGAWSLLLAAVAIEVAGFAVVQAIAVRRLA